MFTFCLQVFNTTYVFFLLSQYDLMVKTYTEAGVDPLDVNYFEGHGTGTKAGDPQEARAIMEAYCKGRKGVLPVGLLKSNIGHGEGASGVASLSKLCIVYENKKIPANLNMTVLKADIAEMVPPLEPVTANRNYEPGIVGKLQQLKNCFSYLFNFVIARCKLVRHWWRQCARTDETEQEGDHCREQADCRSNSSTGEHQWPH